MAISRIWKSLILLGTSTESKEYTNKGVVLTNQISIILLLSSLLSISALFFVDFPYQSINVYVFTGIFIMVLICNGLGYVNFSRLLLGMFPGIVLYIPYVIGLSIHEGGVLLYSFAMITFSIIPVLIFDIKDEQVLLYTSLTINFLAFLFIEQIQFASQESNAVQDFIQQNFIIFKVVTTSFWLFIVLVLLFLARYNRNSQLKIDATLGELAKKNDEVQNQLEKIKKTNKELKQQQKQISKQRDWIEVKNTELKAYQDKLLDYVYQITESKNLLAKKEAENDSLLNALRKNFIMVEFNHDGLITWITPKTLNYLQIENKDIIGKPSLNFIRKIDDNDEVEKAFRKLWKKIQKGEAASADLELKINSKKIHISSTFAPIFDQRGDISKVLSIAEDVSDIIHQKRQIVKFNQILLKQQKEIKEQNDELHQQKEEIGAMNETLEERVKERTVVLEQKNKQLAEYAFINAHLLRSPVSSILGLINLLEYEKLNKEERDIFTYLKKTVQQLDNIVLKINKAIQQNRDFDREFLRE